MNLKSRLRRLEKRLVASYGRLVEKREAREWASRKAEEFAEAVLLDLHDKSRDDLDAMDVEFLEVLFRPMTVDQLLVEAREFCSDSS